MPTGPNSLDDETIRARCASPEAADYTLYVRRLVSGPYAPGGQAEILRIATERGLLPKRYKRQTLSEHLSGRYRHGPPWHTTELIIRCLADHAPKTRIRDEARALHQAASGQPHRRRNAVDMAWPDASATGVRWERHPNAVSDRHLGPDARRPPGSARVPGNAARATAASRPGRNVSNQGYQPGTQRFGRSADPAAEIANLRAECARLAVQVALASDPATTPVHYTDLSAAFVRYQRSQLGQLAERIDPAAPLMRRMLARYLCAYAELGQTPVNELAVRTGLPGRTVADVLAARHLPTEAELSALGAVLGTDGEMVWHLAGQARSEAKSRKSEDGHGRSG